GVADEVRLVSDFPSEREGGALGGREFRPVAVQGRDLVLLQARAQQLALLMPLTILAIVGAANDPEQLDLEGIAQQRAGIAFAPGPTSAPTAAEAAAPFAGGHVVVTETALVAHAAFTEFRLLFLGQLRQRDAGLPGLHVLQI